MTASTFVDMVRVVSGGAGTGPLVLGAAVPTYRGVEQLTDGTTYSYSIQQQPADNETGRGVWNAAAGTLSRIVVESTNNNQPIVVQSGTPINLTVLASDFAATDQAALAAAVLNAQGSAQAAAADVALTAADRVQTGLDRTATGQDRTATHTDRLAADADATQTAADRVQTGLDRTATHNDRLAADGDATQTSADRVQTGLDRTATAADRVQTGLDRTATAADRVQTELDRTASDADAVSTAADRVQTGLDRTATTAVAGSIATAGALSGAYPNAATLNVPRGLTQASVGAITGGSGGTNGTFALSWTGGNFTANPTGTFTVAGGALTAVTITGPGQYIGSSPTVPTPVFTASAGLAGAAVALTAQFLPASGAGYYAQSADGLSLLPYQNVAGVATAVSGLASIDTSTGIDTKFTARGVSSASGLAQWTAASNPGGSPAEGQYLLDISIGPTAFNRIPGGTLTANDGTTLIPKYDRRLLTAAKTAEGLALGPYPIISGGNVVLMYGAGTFPITNTGTADNARMANDGRIVYTDLIKGLRTPVSVDVTGTTFRAITRDTAWDIYTGAGHSALVGVNAPTTADAIPIFPTKTFTLTDRPILSNSTTRSLTATLMPLAEVVTGSFASYFAAGLYIKTSALRPTVKIGVVGHAAIGSLATSDLDQNSVCGMDILASVTRFMTLVGATADRNGALRVRGHIVHHGDGIVSATYASDLVTYQSGWEAAVKAVTGQVEPVYFFLSQSATQQKFANPPTNPITAFTGYLSTLAVTRAFADGGNSKCFPTLADYILTFPDDQHPASGMTGQDWRAEYEWKAVDIVLNQGRDFVAARARPFSYWTLGSGYIDIPCEVQVAPLVIDTAFVVDPGLDTGAVDANGKGFTLSDSNNCRITSVAIRPDGTTIRVSYSGTLGTGRVLEYAATNGVVGKSGNKTNGGPRGCVRDSDPTLSRDGTKTLYNPLWSFRTSF